MRNTIPRSVRLIREEKLDAIYTSLLAGGWPEADARTGAVRVTADIHPILSALSDVTSLPIGAIILADWQGDAEVWERYRPRSDDDPRHWRAAPNLRMTDGTLLARGPVVLLRRP